MKKTAKTYSKSIYRKKKSRKNPSNKKHKKNIFSDSLRAIQLVSILVIISICISFAVIMIYSKLKKPDIAVPGETPVQELIEPEIPDTLSQDFSDITNTNTNTISERIVYTNTSPPAANITSFITPVKPVENQGTLVFVIDDAGNNLHELEPFLRIPGPLTIAVLPGLPYSAEAARRIRAAGKEVILHQPMEAIGAQNPGPGGIYSGMSADDIRSILLKNISEVGPVAGINNHQGSKITMDSEIMKIIMTFCAEHGLYFLDSRTTSETAVPVVAHQLGMKIAERDVFIDNEQNKEAMLRYIAGGLTRAQRNGSSVMIGHTWSSELAALLAEQFPLLTEQGYTLQPASVIINK